MDLEPLETFVFRTRKLEKMMQISDRRLRYYIRQHAMKKAEVERNQEEIMEMTEKINKIKRRMKEMAERVKRLEGSIPLVILE